VADNKQVLAMVLLHRTSFETYVVAAAVVAE